MKHLQPNATDKSAAVLARDHFSRKKLRLATLTACHSISRSTVVQQHIAKPRTAEKRCRRNQRDVSAAAAQQSTAARTPMLQLQERLQESGATTDALDVSYKQCVTTRKLRQGEVCLAAPNRLVHPAQASPIIRLHGLQVLLSIPGDLAVTKEDVAADTACAQIASGRSELVGLALWLLTQRSKVNSCSATTPSQTAFDVHSMLARHLAGP